MRYGPDHTVGEQTLRGMAGIDGETLGFLSGDTGVADANAADLLFLDIESTGLGGAGAFVFLVATGRMEGETFVLRQYLARSPDEEGALLRALIDDARFEEEPVLVTYNGRRFDAPMLDERATMQRQRAGFESMRQVDLLHPVRTIYSGMYHDCRLATIEGEALGLERPEHEVSGGEVPAWYFRYLRSGDGRFLTPLIEHNEQDVVSLAALLLRLAALLNGGRAPSAAEALGLGRLFGRRGDVERARSSLEFAVATLAPSLRRDEAMERLAALHKRRGRRDLAEPLWAELADRPGRGRVRALVELSKYYEHHTKDLNAAHGVVERAMRRANAERARNRERAARWEAELSHRLRRIEWKQRRAASRLKERV